MDLSAENTHFHAGFATHARATSKEPLIPDRGSSESECRDQPPWTTEKYLLKISSAYHSLVFGLRWGIEKIN